MYIVLPIEIRFCIILYLLVSAYCHSRRLYNLLLMAQMHFSNKLNFVESEVDNQLSPLLPLPTSKLERLSRECLLEEFQLPCKPAQKWYCQFEDNRWRKHKCKLQIHLPKAYKKCACITSEGVVYKKVPVSREK